MTESVSLVTFAHPWYPDGRMARARPPHRLADILAAAMRVFARHGLERAKMSDVAAEARVSQGTLYNYGESKEALFRLLLDRGLGAELPRTEAFPVASPSADELARRMEDAVAANFALPRLAAALRRRRAADARAGLAGGIDVRFRRAVGTRGRGPEGAPGHAAARGASFRAGTGGNFGAAGPGLPPGPPAGGQPRGPPPAVTARMILETVTLFARHIYRDPAPPGPEPR